MFLVFYDFYFHYSLPQLLLYYRFSMSHIWYLHQQWFTYLSHLSLHFWTDLRNSFRQDNKFYLTHSIRRYSSILQTYVHFSFIILHTHELSLLANLLCAYPHLKNKKFRDLRTYRFSNNLHISFPRAKIKFQIHVFVHLAILLCKHFRSWKQLKDALLHFFLLT